MEIYWLEQIESDIPGDKQWLSAQEAARLGGFRFAKRRNEWRLGRWTAKRAIAACLNLPADHLTLAHIEIRAAPSGAPQAFLSDQAAPVTISISHRSGTALCAVRRSDASLGCDLEVIEPRGDAFVSDYFTDHEQALVQQAAAAQRPLLVTLLWSAKESALKAMHLGLRAATNSVEVQLVDSISEAQDSPGFTLLPPLASGINGWRPLQVTSNGAQVFRGWWRHGEHLVRTVVSSSM